MNLNLLNRILRPILFDLSKSQTSDRIIVVSIHKENKVFREDYTFDLRNSSPQEFYVLQT